MADNDMIICLVVLILIFFTAVAINFYYICRAKDGPRYPEKNYVTFKNDKKGVEESA